MWTLGPTNNFYKSKEWKKLIEYLKLKRVNEEGELICEHCGRPIVKKYDCIGHHEIELTEENVNDANISLNEDNIKLIHFKCHNEIHNRFGYSKKEVFIIYGPPFAGKHSYVESIAKSGDIICSIDILTEAITTADRYNREQTTRSVVFDARDALIEVARLRKGKWNNFFLVATLASKGERERLSSALNAKEIFIDTSEAECIERCQKHFIDNPTKFEEFKKYILEWFEDFYE